jgi:hypothetical protein
VAQQGDSRANQSSFKALACDGLKISPLNNRGNLNFRPRPMAILSIFLNGGHRFLNGGHRAMMVMRAGLGRAVGDDVRSFAIALGRLI